MNNKSYGIKRRYDELLSTSIINQKQEEICKTPIKRKINSISQSNDVLVLILSYSSFSDIFNFCMVCKQWNKCTKNYYVWKLIMVNLKNSHRLMLSLVIPKYISNISLECDYKFDLSILKNYKSSNIKILTFEKNSINYDDTQVIQEILSLEEINIKCETLNTIIINPKLSSLSITNLKEKDILPLLKIQLNSLTIFNIPPNLSQLTSLIKLTFISSEKQSSFFDIIKKLTKLKVLTLRTPNLNCKNFKLLEECISLKEIEIDGLKINDNHLASLKNCDKITIKNCRNLTKNFYVYLKTIPNLELYIDVMSTELYDIICNPNLKTLYLETMRISHLGTLIIEKLKKLDKVIIKNFSTRLYPQR
jgi:hypothetical protein